ncbi:MAG: thioredoxin family protein [Candidatus Omnitrophica bacterium]|nr:thioredoxin family protein [Candidatus Omnitrophota bacterium]
MKKIITIVIFITGFFTLSFGAWAVSWENDLTRALAKAKDGGKPVMADFYTDWCGWCKKLDQDVYTDAAVNRLAERFVCVKVNCQTDKQAPSRYGVTGYPTIIFFDALGNVQEKVIGYRARQDFINIMNGVLAKLPEPAAPQKRQTVSTAAPKKEAAGTFILTGIMGNKAIVNNKIVEAGSAVDGAKVLRIAPNQVTLQYNGKEMTVRLGARSAQRTILSDDNKG